MGELIVLWVFFCLQGNPCGIRVYEVRTDTRLDRLEDAITAEREIVRDQKGRALGMRVKRQTVN